MSGINLIPVDRITRAATRRRIRVWAVRAVVVAVVGGLAIVAGLRRVRSLSAEAAQLESEFILQQDRVDLAETLIDTRDLLSESRQSIYAIHDQAPFVSGLNALGRSLPPGTMLTYLQIETGAEGEDDETHRPPVVLRGHASDHTEVGTLLRALETTAGLRDVNLVRLTEHDNRKERIVEFEIAASVAEWGGPR